MDSLGQELGLRTDVDPRTSLTYVGDITLRPSLSQRKSQTQ